MGQGNFKDLPRRTASGKVIRDKVFNIAKNSKYDGYQRGITLIVYKFFGKTRLVVVLKSKVMLNQKLSEELHYSLISKFEKHISIPTFNSINNIWGSDIVDTQLISKFDKRFQILLCVIDTYIKYAQVVPLTIKKCITTDKDFIKNIR